MTYRLKLFWRSRSDKEQRLIILGSFVVLVAVLYYGAYKPLMDSIEQAQADLHHDSELLQWMKEQSPRVLQARRGGGAVFQGSIFSLVEQRLKPISENSPRITRVDDDRVSVWFEEVNFNELMKVLETIHREHGIQIETFKVTQLNEPGFVQATFKLKQ